MFFQNLKRGNNTLGSYLITLFLVFIGYGLLGMIPLSLLQLYKVETDRRIGTDELQRFTETLDFSIIHVDKNIGLVSMILVFVITMACMYVGIRYFHKLQFKDLITPAKSINFNKVLYAFMLWGGLLIIGEGVSYMLSPDHYTLNFSFGAFLVLLLICAFLLPFQTTLEELFFRGYLMPAFGQIFNNKWIPLIISSILFASVHLMNPEVEKFGMGIMVTYYMLAGLFLGIITIWDDSLELAIGVHAATNFFSALLITFDGSVLQTDALFRVSETDPYLMTFIFLIASIVFIFVAGKKYHWDYKALFSSIKNENYL